MIADKDENTKKETVLPFIVAVASGLLLAAWNGLLEALSKNETLGVILSDMGPVVNSAVVSGAVVFIATWIWFTSRLKKITRELADKEQSNKFLQRQISRYEEATDRVQVSIDVDDYLEVRHL